MNYNKKTTKELKLLCKDHNIKGFNNKNKQSLIELLNKTNVPVIDTIKHDMYTEEILKDLYLLHKQYNIGRTEITKKIGCKVRLSGIPEDVIENIIKFIIHNKLNDETSIWNRKTGDLYSQKEGTQECKCFTSSGPSSFTPVSDWDVIYFLDAREWLRDFFILYRIPLKRTSEQWKNIKVSEEQTFEDQVKQGRRPRIIWESLKSQLGNYCSKVYEGTLNDIFIHSKVNE